MIDAKQIKGIAAFSVYGTDGSQVVAAGSTDKVTLITEHFDTEGDFSSYRHTPSIGGYWAYFWGTTLPAIANTKWIQSMLYKNGAVSIEGSRCLNGAASQSNSVGSALIEMNGSTDYVELFCHNGDTNPHTLSGNAKRNFLMGICLRR